MRGAACFLAALATLAATPALAADPAQLSCPRDRLSETQRTQLVEAAGAFAPMTDPRIAPIIEAVQACGRQHGWSAAAIEAARQHQLLISLLEAHRRPFAGRNIDLAELERVVAGDSEFVESFRGGEANGPQTRAFFRRNMTLMTRLVGGRMDESSRDLGAFVAVAALKELTRRDFVAN